MANEEQIALLRQGGIAWNAWRKKHSDEALPSFHEVDLKDNSLQGANLRGINFLGASLERTNLENADLERAQLYKANLHKANLYGANLKYANLCGANLLEAQLSQADLREANLLNAQLCLANLDRADLRGVNFASANLAKALLPTANLERASLERASLARSSLREANLQRANLRGANLQRANLVNANLCFADLRGANLRAANLQKANLSYAQLGAAKLIGADLWQTNLTGADLRRAVLEEANLGGSDLRGSNLQEAHLESTNFEGADLRGADMSSSHILRAMFIQVNLTGACIADWHIGSSTILERVECDYVFRTYDLGGFSGRLPVNPEEKFAPGEFIQRFQIISSALETIDITFTKGIDWQAFFKAFQDLRTNRPDEDISIQAMERKGDAFIVRLEAEAGANKGSIETEVKQLYATQLAALEAQYKERLRLQSEEITTYRQTQSSLLHIVQTMAEKNSISQNFHGPVGNVAGTNHGSMTAYISQNNEAISQLITALRASAQAFPEEQKDEVLMELDDLETDLSKPEQQEPKRIGKRLQRLIATGMMVARIVGGSATFSDNLNEFTENVFELGEKVGLSRDAIQDTP